MSGRALEVFCDDERYPAMTDAQLSECVATIRAFSQGQPVRLESESWFGNFRSLLPMYWKYKQDAEYWKSWQDPDKIKRLEAENADLLAIAQGQREEIRRLQSIAGTENAEGRGEALLWALCEFSNDGKEWGWEGVLTEFDAPDMHPYRSDKGEWFAHARPIGTKK